MSRRLRATTLEVRSLTPPQREQMLTLMQRIYEGVEPADFARDLDAKQWVILLLDRDRLGVVGFSTIALEQVSFRDRPAELLFSGDTVIDPAYWGQKVLDAAFARFLVWRKVRRPWRPFFWLLLSAGFKTYLLILNYFPNAFPRVDGSPDPEEAAFLEDYCRKRWGEDFDRDRGVVRLSGNYRVRTGIAPITEAELRHPDIAFFSSRNPGHLVGEELVCLAQVRLGDLVAAFGRIARKRWQRRASAPRAAEG